MQAEVITGAVGLFLIQEAIVLFTFEKFSFLFYLSPLVMRLNI